MTKATTFGGPIAVFGFAVAMAANSMASAQTESSDSTKSKGVETVVVTAERRSENLQRAPVAATVMSADDLKTHNVTGIDGLEFSTPSLTVGSNGQSNQINIRGIGKEDNSGTATSAIAIYRDGIGTVSGFATNEPYYDIASVEVLRGPQGTFSGENAAGGAIFVNTRDPDPNGGYTGYGELGYGNYNEFDSQGAINLPITDTFAARIAFDHVNRDSFFTAYMNPAMTIRNPEPIGARDYNNGRLGLLWQPTEDLQIKFKFDYNNLDNHGYAFGVVPGWPIPGADDFGDCPCAANISKNPFVIGNNSTDNYAVDKNARGALDIHYTFGGGYVLRSLYGEQWEQSYIRNDDDGSAFVDRRQHINATWKIYSEELTLASPDTDRFNWILGAFYKRETLDFPPNDGFVLTDNTHYAAGGVPIYDPAGNPNPGLSPSDAVPTTEIILVWHTPRTTKAGFGQISYNITDALKVQFGLRYQSYINTETSDLSLPIFNLVLPTATPRYSEDALTGKLAVNYQLNDDHYLYSFVATGNTTGGVSVVFGDPNFIAQKTTDAEAGWKAQWLDNHISTQIGGFYDWIKHYQAFFTDPVTTLGTYQNLAGISKLYGVELTGQAVFDNLSLDTGLSLMHSSLGDAEIEGAGGVIVPTNGKPQPYTPTITFHGGAQYAFPIFGDTTLTPRVDFAYVGRQTMTPVDQFFNGIALDRTPPHRLLNLKLTYATENWNAEAYMTNATDDIYYEAHGGPGYNAYPNEPRRFGVLFHYNF